MDVRRLARHISDHSLVLFLGDVDVGKTTLIKRLNELVGGEIVDADVGQSAIGPPAVISLGAYGRAPRAGYFAGDISPVSHFLHVLTGCEQMVSRASRPCLIDTDGYIHDGAARALKSELINLIRPDLLVLLRRQNELDYFKLYARKGIEVLELPVRHRGVKAREERIRARQLAFRNYFLSARLRTWRLKNLSFERTLLGHGEPLATARLSRALDCRVIAGWKEGSFALLIFDGPAPSLEKATHEIGARSFHLMGLHSLKGLLLGCVLEGEFQGLGILKSISKDRIEILTPVERSTILQAGSLQVSEDGRHARIRLNL